MNDSINKSIRRLSSSVALDRISDLEIRRCIQAALERIQWMLDNWPATSVPLQFKFSVQNYSGVVQLVGDELPRKKRRYYGTNEFSKLGFHDLPDAVKYDMSVVVTDSVVTLKNDEREPDYGQYYAVGVDSEKGWQYPREHPFRFQQTNDNGGDITAGLVRLNGANLSILNLPSSLSSITESTRYWIALDTENATAEWIGGAVSTYATFPTGSDTIMIFPILTITCSGAAGSEYISDIKQERWVDIVEGATDVTEDSLPTPTAPVYEREIDDTTTADIALDWTAGDVNGGGQLLGLSYTFHTLPEYDESDHKWYSYVRTMTITAKGTVQKLTTATKVEVHAPVGHSTLPAP